MRVFNRMAKFTASAVVLLLLGRLIASFSPGSIFGVLGDVGLLGLIVSGCYYFWRVIKWLKHQLLWKVRNKIIISFAFVGILPLVIFALISWQVFGMIFGQLGALYVRAEFTALAGHLEELNRRICSDVREPLQGLASQGLRLSKVDLSRMNPVPGDAELLVFGGKREHSQAERGEPVLLWTSRLSNPDTKVEGTDLAPSWIGDDFEGLVASGDRLYFVNAQRLSDGDLVVLRLRLDDTLTEYLTARTSIQVSHQATNPRDSAQFQRTFSEFSAGRPFLSVPWVHFLTPVDWNSGQAVAAQSLFLSIPILTLLRQLFNQAEEVLVFIVILGIAFFLVELIALLIGITIARSITVSIHNIYEGTQSIEGGNFGFRIPSRERDQLDAMADSFNKMSGSIVRLMQEVSAKERIEKELEIAREVQEQLFPQQLPLLDRLEVSAICRPARQVSGDYYDFRWQADDFLEIVIGDISGKGISAALLMASLQTMIRGQLDSPSLPLPESERLPRILKSVNTQMYRNSSPAAFSTLVLAHLDPHDLRVTYCNAGHHPPLLFSNGEVRRLEAGGTVVGLFESVEYEAASVTLSKGDVLLFYTDGVIEAENSSGEQLGGERVVELVKPNLFLTADDIQGLIVDEVFRWSQGQEQADDITVLCLKVTG